MASEDRSLSEFPRALQVAEQALVMISNPDGLGGYDTNSALLTEVGRAILAVQYTQQLGNVSVFDAIKNTRVLSGTTTPTANEGANGQLYVKYETVSNVDNVVGMYFKKDGAWLEISLGGGGNTDYIECTQAQYDAWEQGGTLDPDTLYFITDGNIGNDIIDDSTASETTVYSSDKVEDLLSDKADSSDVYTKTEVNTALSGKADNSTVNGIIGSLNGAKFEFGILDGNSDIFSKEYTTLCVALVARGRGGIYIGSNADIQTVATSGSSSDIAPYKVANKNQIRLVNNSSYTSTVLFIHD